MRWIDVTKEYCGLFWYCTGKSAVSDGLWFISPLLLLPHFETSLFWKFVIFSDFLIIWLKLTYLPLFTGHERAILVATFRLTTTTIVWCRQQAWMTRLNFTQGLHPSAPFMCRSYERDHANHMKNHMRMERIGFLRNRILQKPRNISKPLGILKSPKNSFCVFPLSLSINFNNSLK